MGVTSEKWELHIGKKIHIISGEELEFILQAQSNRFIRFGDLIINPAFIEQIIQVQSDSIAQIAGPYEGNLPAEDWLEKHDK